jgi:hypothetical protein
VYKCDNDRCYDDCNTTLWRGSIRFNRHCAPLYCNLLLRYQYALWKEVTEPNSFMRQDQHMLIICAHACMFAMSHYTMHQTPSQPLFNYCRWMDVHTENICMLWWCQCTSTMMKTKLMNMLIAGLYEIERPPTTENQSTHIRRYGNRIPTGISTTTWGAIESFNGVAQEPMQR